MAQSLPGANCDPNLLQQQEECSFLLRADPHNPIRHLKRGQIHSKLGFPDLAAGDAYRALTLLDSVIEPDCSEYPARKRTQSSLFQRANDPVEDAFAGLSMSDDEEEDDEDMFEPFTHAEYTESIGDVYILLVESLVQCGCLRDAYDCCMQAMRLSDGEEKVKDVERDEALMKLLGTIKQSLANKHDDGNVVSTSPPDINPAKLEGRGYARRVVYPWNTHEPDRNSPDIYQFLNERLKHVAPRCEVRIVELPSLHEDNGSNVNNSGGETEGNSDSTDQKISLQLGLFAKEDIAPGESLLHESSMLTATNRLHDDICDACNITLPEISSSEPPVACENCDDTIFCSQKCHDVAQETYHGAVCGREGLESIGKDVPDPKDKADYLYLLLLERAIAMSATQTMHPLDLPEIKYIWGDFHDMEPNTSPSTKPPASATLPFSFQLNIVQPMRIVDEMGIDPFKSLHLYDTWVFNTLYAKFRGTASGRLSTWDGGPEVCAVHPLWCLANHSCDPNVRWEWGGEITFVARGEDERVKWGSEEDQDQRIKRNKCGIKKDEEILNHYCDIDLKVKDRREWAMGALGGKCLCERCIWEAEHIP